MDAPKLLNGRELGVVLGVIRRSRALSLDDLAELAGMSHTTIWKIETGRTESVRLATVKKLAEALQVEPAVLLYDTAAHAWLAELGRVSP